MNLLIIEYTFGGGYAGQKLSASILSEAYGMVRSFFSDCKAAGHNVTTLLDSRIKEFNPPIEVDKVFSISSPKEFYAKLEEFSGRVDAVYVIAPESGQVLEKLVETVKASDGTSVNCDIDAIRQVSNKMRTYEILKQKGLKTPETVLLDITEKTENIIHLTNDLGFPMVFKPLDGVSCDGLSIVKDEGDIVGAVKKVAGESMRKQFIAQKLISGDAASACVISTGDRALSITLNRQFVTLASPDGQSKYYGGVVPFDHKLEENALKIAEKATEAVSGLKGYVGVDMILTDEEPLILEINPRLTMSYIGLRKVANFNSAETIINAAIRRKLPSTIQKKGYVLFAKVQVPSLPQRINETYRLKNVISPPFPIQENIAFALIATSSGSTRGAKSKFYRTKKRLLKIYSRGD